MSKIYEALLRAELERAVATGQPTNGTSVAVQEFFAPADELGPSVDFNNDFEPASPYEPPSRTADGPLLEFFEIPQHNWQPSLIALPALEERGPGVEQFRNLRSHVAEFREQRPLKSILVSSGLPGEGKSFVALNLAMSFARHKGNRVLLIDGDMRRGTLHTLLGAPREPGLAEYLSGTTGLLQVLQRPTLTPSLPAGLASLAFIAGGRDADKAGDLASNQRFEMLISQVRSVFDWVIVDSSPVNLVADAVNLARCVDGVLLVCREGVTKFRTAQQAQAQFKSTNVLGFVLNAVHKLPKGDYYGSYDGYKAEA